MTSSLQSCETEDEKPKGAELEFGHWARNGSGFCIDAWGAGPFLLVVDDHSFRFEDSDRFGPYLVSKRGDILQNQPAERSPFWRAHRCWVRQGRQLDADGITCVWREPHPTVFKRLNKSNVLEVLAGEEDGRLIDQDSDEGRAILAEKGEHS